MRVLPVLLNYAEKFNEVPELIALGFAAYIRFMKPASREGEKVYGEANGQKYLINDTLAAYVADIWDAEADNIVEAILADEKLWGTSLVKIPNFATSVASYLPAMENPKSIKEAIAKQARSLVS